MKINRVQGVQVPILEVYSKWTKRADLKSVRSKRSFGVRVRILPLPLDF